MRWLVDDDFSAGGALAYNLLQEWRQTSRWISSATPTPDARARRTSLPCQMLSSLPASARFVPKPSPHRLVLFDVMDTLVVDPFFLGMEKDLFGLDGGIKSLFAVKDQVSFVQFEKGEISEAEHFETYFNDRRPCDGAAVKSYMLERYAWLPGMKELATDLQAAGIPMAAFSNCAQLSKSAPSPRVTEYMRSPLLTQTLRLGRLSSSRRAASRLSCLGA